MTRRKGGSFESRSLQACPLQPRHALQRKTSSRYGVGVPLERRTERTAAPAQGCSRHNQTIPHRSGGQQGSRPVKMPAQREQTIFEPQGNDVWGTRQPLSEPRITAFSKSARKANKSYVKNWIEAKWHGHLACNLKTMQIQEWLDRIQRPDGTKLKIKNVLSAIFSHGVRWELVERNPVCGQGGSPGHRGASTGVRQRNRVSIQRVILAPDIVRQTLEQLPLREAAMAVHLPNPVPPSHPPCDRESLWNQEQQGSTDRMAHATPLTRDIADLKRGEREGRAIAASSHNPKDHPGPLCTSGFSRSAGSPQEGRPDGASSAISGATEGEKRSRNCVETGMPLVLGVRGCPKINPAEMC